MQCSSGAECRTGRVFLAVNWGWSSGKERNQLVVCVCVSVQLFCLFSFLCFSFGGLGGGEHRSLSQSSPGEEAEVFAGGPRCRARPPGSRFGGRQAPWIRVSSGWRKPRSVFLGAPAPPQVFSFLGLSGSFHDFLAADLGAAHFWTTSKPCRFRFFHCSPLRNQPCHMFASSNFPDTKQGCQISFWYPPLKGGGTCVP